MFTILLVNERKGANGTHPSVKMVRGKPSEETGNIILVI
jgi:hypothetical protein